MSTQNGNNLLTYAISRLYPDVFSHPVWTRFGYQQNSASPRTIDELLILSKALQHNDPSGACQILLICAVYQNHAGQPVRALSITQQVLTLAKHAGLAKEAIWAKWAMCAICFQQEDYQLAGHHLEELRALLEKQKDWVLADYVEIIKEALYDLETNRSEETSGSPHDPPNEELLTSTFDWLQNWEVAPQTSGSTNRLNSGNSVHQTPSQYRSKQRRWEGWNNFILTLRNRLNLHSTESDSYPARKESSFWESLLDSLHLNSSSQEANTRVSEEAFQPPGISTLPRLVENSPLTAQSPKSKQTATDKQTSRKKTTKVPVIVQMLGSFSITVQDSPFKLPATRGLSLFKYLLLHHKQDTPRDVLMDIFWSDAYPEAARNNLNVAMHTLRQSLHTFTNLAIIHYENGTYGLDPNLEIWLDVEEFERCVKEGQRLEAQNQLTTAVTEYEIAVNLYQGDFLADNPYESWTVLDRERLRISYLDILDHLSQIYFKEERYAACVNQCQLILARDLCREDAHCRLMQCYSRLGQIPLAVRQFQICVEALHTELEVDPAPETTQLYERIRRHEHI